LVVSTTSPAAAPSPAAPTAEQLAADAIAPTEADRALMKDISIGILLVEGRDWKRTRIGKDPTADALVDRMYAAGAERVYIDRRGGISGKPARLYVQLPASAEGQASCRAAYQAYLQENSITLPPLQPATRRFLLVPIQR
jgi:hypothetical protein